MVLRGRLPLGTAADLRDPFYSRGTGNVPQGSFPRESCCCFFFCARFSVLFLKQAMDG